MKRARALALATIVFVSAIAGPISFAGAAATATSSGPVVESGTVSTNTTTAGTTYSATIRTYIEDTNTSTGVSDARANVTLRGFNLTGASTANAVVTSTGSEKNTTNVTTTVVPSRDTVTLTWDGSGGSANDTLRAEFYLSSATAPTTTGTYNVSVAVDETPGVSGGSDTATIATVDVTPEPIEGVVFGPSGTNVTGDTVFALTSSGVAASTQVTANGSYALDVPGGTAYQLAYYENGPDVPSYPADSIADVYAPNTTATAGDFVSMQVGASRHHVRVLDDTQTPVANASVDVVLNGTSVGIGGWTNESGYLVLEGAASAGIDLANANATVGVSTPNRSALGDARVGLSASSPTTTVVLPTQETTTSETVRLNGTVLRPDNSTSPRDWIVVASSTAGVATNLSASGTYNVSVERNTTYELSYYENTPPGDPTTAVRDGVPDTAVLGTVNASANVTRGPTTLPTASVVNVTVRDESGDPVPNATVTVESENQAGFASLPVNAEGELQVNGTTHTGVELADGNASVAARLTQNGTVVASNHTTVTVTGPTSVTLTLDVTKNSEGASGGGSDGGSSTPSTVTVNGTVTYANNTAASGHRVFAVTNESVQYTDTDPNGWYEFDVPSETPVNVAFFENSSAPGVPTQVRDGVPDFYGIATVNLTANTSLGHTVLPEGHVLDVTVVNETGAPVENASVLVRNETNIGYGGLPVDAQGRLHVPNATGTGLELANDTYVVNATLPSGDGATASNRTTVTVAGETSVTLTLDVNTTSGDSDGDAAQTRRSPVNVTLSALAGNGTPSDPYRLTNGSELNAVRQNLSAHYVLATDIDASNTQYWHDGQGFAPIGDSWPRFTGTFDGNGHTISGLTIDRPGTYEVGLFASSAGRITNLTLADVAVRGGDTTAALVAENDGVVANVTVTGTVTGETAGALVGRHGGGAILHSTANATVRGEYGVGGLVGESRSLVFASSATGHVVGQSSVGGLVGTNDGVISTSWANASVNGDYGAAGLAGRNYEGIVTDSYAVGPVSASDADEAGGLVPPDSDGTVRDSYWDVAATGQSTSGGGVGLATAELTGQAAPSNMTGLDFETDWTTTDGYPAVIESATPANTTVTGTLVDANGDPVRNATVTLVGHGQSSSVPVNANGTFAFTQWTTNPYGVPDGTYTLSIDQQRAGYPLDGVPDFAPLGTVAVDGTTTLRNVTVPTAHRVNVTVRDQNGTPVSNLALSATVQQPFIERFAQTDAQGRLVFGGTPGIELASETTFTETSERVTQQSTVRANGTQNASLTMRVQRLAHVRMHVTQNGSDVSGAQLQTSLNGDVVDQQSLDDGNASVYVPPNETRAFGLVQSWRGPRDGIPAVYALDTVTPSLPGTNQTVSVPRAHVLNLTVTSADGVPVQSHDITIYSTQNNTTTALDARTNANGSLVVAGTPGVELAGNVTVVLGDRYAEYTPRVWSFNVTSNTTRTVSTGYGSVTGRLVTADGTPVTNTTVTLEGPDYHEQSVAVNATGWFSVTDWEGGLGGVPNGTYTLSLSQAAANYPLDGVADVGNVTSISVAAGADLGNVTVPTAHRVNVTVLNQDDQRVPNVPLRVSPENVDAWPDARTNANGSLVIGNTTGIELSGPAEVWVGTERYTITSDNSLAGTQNESLTLRVEQQALVNVSFVGPDGMRVETLDSMQARPDGGWSRTGTTTDVTFSAEPNQPRSYGTVQAYEDFPRDDIPDVYAVANVSAPLPGVDLGTRTIPAAHRLNATITDGNGTPIANQPLTLTAHNGSARLSIDARTDSQGRLVVGDTVGTDVVGTVTIAAGEYYEEPQATWTLNVTSDTTTTLAVNASSLDGNVTGRIVGPNGHPVGEVFLDADSETHSVDVDAQTLASGHFGFDAPNGTWRIHVSDQQPGDGIVDTGTWTRTWNDSASRSLGTLTLPAGYEFAPRLQDTDGTAVSAIFSPHDGGQTLATGENHDTRQGWPSQSRADLPAGTTNYTVYDEWTGDELGTVSVTMPEENGTQTYTVDHYAAAGMPSADGFTVARSVQENTWVMPTWSLEENGVNVALFVRNATSSTNATITETLPANFTLDRTVGLQSEGTGSVSLVEADGRTVTIHVSGNVSTIRYRAATDGTDAATLNWSGTYERAGTTTTASIVGETTYAVSNTDDDSGGDSGGTDDSTVHVNGTVTRPDGTSAVGDQVVVLDATGAYETATDVIENGAFSVDVTRGETHHVFYYENTSEPGLPTQVRDEVPDFALLGTVNGTTDVTLGHTTLAEGHTLNVTVVNETGARVPNASVGVGLAAGAGGGYHGLPVDAQGRLHVPNATGTGLEVANGTYTVTARYHESGAVVAGNRTNVTVAGDTHLRIVVNTTSTLPRTIAADGFETDSVGSLPADWSRMGNANSAVVDTVASEGERALRLTGSAGGCWEALAGTSAPMPDTTPQSSVAISFDVYPTTNGTEGCHSHRAGAGLKTGTASWDTDGVTLINFETDGHVYGSGVDLGTYDTGTWTDVTITYQRTDGQVTLGYYINGDYRGQATREPRAYEDALDQFVLKSGEFTSYYDDVSIRQVSGPAVPAVHVNGSVLRPNGTAATDGGVVAFDLQGPDYASAALSANGTYALNVTAGVPHSLLYLANVSETDDVRDGVPDLHQLGVVNATSDVARGPTTLPPGHVLNVTVRNTSGAVVPNVTVGVGNASTHSGVTGLATNANGSLVLDNVSATGIEVANGTYVVQARHWNTTNGTETVRAQVNETVTVAGPTDVTLTLNTSAGGSSGSDGSTGGGSDGGTGDDGSGDSDDGGSDETSSANVSVVNASLSTTEATVGDDVTVTAVLENTGDANGTKTVVLTRDGEPIAQQTVTVNASETKTVTFTRTLMHDGTHTFAVNNETAGTVEVSLKGRTSGSTPGMGVGTALVGLLVAAVLALRRD
ncbi:PGF-CTERM sorting domain-containing protein [Halarchaeum sp. P4]|uniref:PGF-CTERM sorting domain-containing protein n=1 Tax=Halarchaeum sp. P4 TaxID=3421639 RepID=UPI003EBA3E87